MRIGFKGKRLIKIIALALASVAAITAVGFGVKAIVDYTKNDLKKITPTFSVGNLGSDGKFVDDKSTLYTKDAFKCEGLQIKLDFDNQINYQIFYYDDLDNFIESTSIFSESYSGGIHDSYARLVIIPTADEDGKISLMEKISYPRQMDIEVSKTQDTKYYDFAGRRLKTVTDVSLLRFEFGKLIYVDGKYVFDLGADNYTIACSDLLSVKGGSKVKFNCDYGFSTGTPTLIVTELKVIDGRLSVIKFSTSLTSEYVLSKDCEYLILEFNVIEEGGNHLAFEADFLPRIPSYISITK